MTPEQYKDHIQEQIKESTEKIKKAKHMTRLGVLLTAILWVGSLLIGILSKDIQQVDWLIFITSTLFGLSMYADAFSIYNLSLTQEEKDRMAFPNYLDKYNYVKHRQYWIFYRPSIRTSYTFFDEEFNIVIRDLHLKRTYQESLNNELYNLDNDNFDKSDLVIDKLLTEIDML